MPQDAVHDLLGEPAVLWSQCIEARIGFETMLDEVPCRGALKGPEGNLSWSGVCHAAILSANRISASPQFPPDSGRGEIFSSWGPENRSPSARR